MIEWDILNKISLYNEFKGQLSIQMLNSLCDGNYKVNTKGGSACIGWDIQVIIYSNYSMAHRVRDLCLRKLFCTIRLGVFIGHVANELALVQDGVTVGVGLHLLHLMGDYHNSEKIMSMLEEESGREIRLIL